MLRKITKIILIVVAVGLSVYDIVPYMNPQRGDTISEVIMFYGTRCLTLPLALGVLMGHFFVPVKDNAKQCPYILINLALIGILSDITINMVNNMRYLVIIYSYPIIWLLIGIPIGAMFWQQKRED